MKRLFITLFCLMLLLPQNVIALTVNGLPEFEPNYVNDKANVISEEVEQKIITLNKELEEISGAQFSVTTVDTLNGESIDDVSLNLARKLQLGDKEKNNGVSILIAIEDHEVKIEVGYGCEWYLTDSYSYNMLQKYLIPYFKNEEYDKGVDSLITVLSDVMRENETLTYEQFLENAAIKEEKDAERREQEMKEEEEFRNNIGIILSILSSTGLLFAICIYFIKKEMNKRKIKQMLIDNPLTIITESINPYKKEAVINIANNYGEIVIFDSSGCLKYTCRPGENEDNSYVFNIISDLSNKKVLTIKAKDNYGRECTKDLKIETSNINIQVNKIFDYKETIEILCGNVFDAELELNSDNLDFMNHIISINEYKNDTVKLVLKMKNIEKFVGKKIEINISDNYNRNEKCSFIVNRTPIECNDVKVKLNRNINLIGKCSPLDNIQLNYSNDFIDICDNLIKAKKIGNTIVNVSEKEQGFEKNINIEIVPLNLSLSEKQITIEENDDIIIDIYDLYKNSEFEISNSGDVECISIEKLESKIEITALYNGQAKIKIVDINTKQFAYLNVFVTEKHVPIEKKSSPSSSYTGYKSFGSGVSNSGFTRGNSSFGNTGGFKGGGGSFGGGGSKASW